MSTPATIATVIIGVLAGTGLLAWMMWRAYRSVERAERDPKYLRRNLIRGAMIYVFGVVFGIVEIARGELPIQSLIGFPIPLFIIWVCLRTAGTVNVPRE